MPTLIFRIGEDCHDVGVGTVYGAYVLQSVKYPTQFRVGIAGQRNLGTFRKRLRLHMRSGASPHNWTTRNRPWRPLWTLEMVGGTALATCMVEHLLYFSLALHHSFTNNSGFTARADQASAIVDAVVGRTDQIIALVQAQLGIDVEVVRPFDSSVSPFHCYERSESAADVFRGSIDLVRDPASNRHGEKS